MQRIVEVVNNAFADAGGRGESSCDEGGEKRASSSAAQKEKLESSSAARRWRPLPSC